MYLYRAIDSEGNTLEDLVSPTSDAKAAKRFFCQALPSTGCSASRAGTFDQQEARVTTVAEHMVTRSALRVINVDKNAAYPKAIADLKAAGMLAEGVELRQVKYLNNVVEQGHRFMKRLVKPGMGFVAFESAWKTLQGHESMNMIRKGQMCGVANGDIQVTFIASLFGVAAQAEQEGGPSCSLRSMLSFCNTTVFFATPALSTAGYVSLSARC
jgi:transposase, IS6 family